MNLPFQTLLAAKTHYSFSYEAMTKMRYCPVFVIIFSGHYYHVMRIHLIIAMQFVFSRKGKFPRWGKNLCTTRNMEERAAAP